MYRRVLLLLGLVVSLSAGSAIDPQASKINLAPLSSFYIDPTGEMEIEDIARPEVQKQFRPLTKEIPGFGYSGDTYWIKVPLQNSSEESLRRILHVGYAALNHVVFYEQNDTAYYPTKVGTWYPETIEHRGYSLSVRLMPKSQQIYYIQVKTLTSSVTLPLTLWQEDALDKSAQFSNYFIGLAMGALAVIGIYNLFLFFVIRDTAYLYYVGYVVTMFFYEASNSGISNLYFWPGHVFLNTYVQTINIFAMSIFAFAFSHAFLGIRESHPKISVFMKFAMSILGLCLLFSFTDMSYSMKVATTLVGISIVIVISLGVYRYVEGYKPARYYLLAWGILSLAIVAAVLRNWGIIPTFAFTFWMLYGIAVLETVLLSFALADRITLFRREKEAAQRALMENHRTMQVTLEKEVREKTAHLEHALGERETLLQELNHRVKNNMQLIVSLLRLQARDVDDERLREKFAIAENRINAMGKLHEMFYKQKDILHLDTARYLRELIGELEKSIRPDNVTVHLQVDEDIPAEKAIYVGLIVNELVSNAFKYAFDGKEGSVHIRLEATHEGKHRLVIRDDGNGFDPRLTEEGLGTQLVNTLVANQLMGTIQCSSDANGTVYEVRF